MTTSRCKRYPKVAVYSKSKYFLLRTVGNIFKGEFSARFNITSQRNNFRIEKVPDKSKFMTKSKAWKEE
jgi:hypothetical protein